MAVYQQSEKNKHQRIAHVEDIFAEEREKLKHKVRRNTTVTHIIMHLHSRDDVPYSGQSLRNAFKIVTGIFKEIQIIVRRISAEHIEN